MCGKNDKSEPGSRKNSVRCGLEYSYAVDENIIHFLVKYGLLMFPILFHLVHKTLESILFQMIASLHLK